MIRHHKRWQLLHLPSGDLSSGYTNIVGIPNYARWSVHSMLLPYLEQANLYNSITFIQPPDTPGMGGVINFMPAYTSPGGVNTVASQTLVSMFLCPSDMEPSSPTGWMGQNNYAGNQGSWLCDRSDQPGAPTDVSPAEVQTGVLYYRLGAGGVGCVRGLADADRRGARPV